MNWHSYFDFKKLKQESNDELVGCPFCTDIGGPIPLGQNKDREDFESQCDSLCGIMFHEEYQELKCPCDFLPEEYVKARFWESISQ